MQRTWEQARNLVVIKISVVAICSSVPLFILMLEIIFVYVKIVVHPLWYKTLDFRYENNDALGVLIKKIQYS